MSINIDLKGWHRQQSAVADQFADAYAPCDGGNHAQSNRQWQSHVSRGRRRGRVLGKRIPQNNHSPASVGSRTAATCGLSPSNWAFQSTQTSTSTPSLQTTPLFAISERSFSTKRKKKQSKESGQWKKSRAETCPTDNEHDRPAQVSGLGWRVLDASVVGHGDPVCWLVTSDEIEAK